MKKTLLAFASAITLLTFQAAPASAQTPVAAPAPATTKATPALWVVKDADTTIYLFGTFHLMRPDVDWNHGAVKAAFDKSDSLRLEIANLEAEGPAIAQLMATQGQLPAGQTIYDGLSDSQKARLDKIIAATGIPPQAMQPMRPWLASLVLSLSVYAKLGLNPEQGIDKTLDSLARAANKPVEGFETGAEQVGFFASMSEAQQRQMLVATIEDWDQISTMIDQMVVSWKTGNEQQLADLMNASLRTQPELAKLLLSDRNERWANWIAGRMAQPGTVFVAVGAGHLAGTDSVQSFLERKGIKSQRVNPNAR